jgi:filamentous hemagglutinin
VEPPDSLDIFNKSISAGKGETRLAMDANGNIHRYFSDGNGTYHWSGSTGNSNSGAALTIDELRKAGFNTALKTLGVKK